MNTIEKALMHALFLHLHHNIEKAIDFEAIEELNSQVNKIFPNALVVGPGDDAAVFNFPDTEGTFVAKMESHCSPCVPRPFDAAATGAGGAMRDVLAMGARPVFLMNFIGTRPLHEKVIVGPCGFDGKCTCGKCIEMTSKERVDLMVKGLSDMCKAMDVFIIGGGFSTSFSDIVPAVVVSVVGKLVTEKPLTKPAKSVGDRIILIGETGNDGNDTLYRAGLVQEMRPAVALFEEERQIMEATLAAFRTGKVKACSDLGAAGIGAAVCESARYGGFGAKADLTNVHVKVEDITPEEIMICETQGRMVVQVEEEDVDEILAAIRSKGPKAEVIAEMTDDDKQVFEYRGKTIAVIPNHPSESDLEELTKEA
ncbi:MAG: phosphoribosylformylglycinamidine synthase [Candidatus Aminicenantes bacterium]|nr:phosphoribosylformylglycinamidine synthase [Candidatus Aminicenantes bacterium]